MRLISYKLKMKRGFLPWYKNLPNLQLKPKPMLGAGYITLSANWFIGLSASVVIGQRNY